MLKGSLTNLYMKKKFNSSKIISVDNFLSSLLSFKNINNYKGGRLFLFFQILENYAIALNLF